jgi:uncharacterized protein (TIGR01244 family)
VSGLRARGALVAVVLVSACGGRAEESTAVAAEPMPSAVPTAAREELAPAELLPDGRRLEDGLLVGGQPSLEQLERLGSLGYRTVITLRTEEEGGPTGREVEALGLSYLRLPVDGAADINEEKARTLDLVLEQVQGPVVLHCGSGNRVGALLALRAHFVDGASPAEALRVGREAGLTGLEPVVRERLGLQRE